MRSVSSEAAQSQAEIIDPAPRHSVPIVEPAAVSEIKIDSSPVVDSRLARFVSEGQPIRIVSRLLKRVEKICTNSEKPEYIAVQHLPAIASPDAIVLTNRRVIVFRSKALGRVNVLDVSWLNVQDIHISEGILGASIYISGVNGFGAKIDHLPKEQARSIYRVGQEREEYMREVRRQRRMEEARNASNSVVVNTGDGGAPPAAMQNDMAARLAQLKSMFDAGLITEEEFCRKKGEILSDL